MNYACSTVCMCQGRRQILYQDELSAFVNLEQQIDGLVHLIAHLVLKLDAQNCQTKPDFLTISQLTKL